MSTNSLSLKSGSHLSFELDGVVAGTSYGQIQTGGAISLNADAGAGATLDLALGYTPANGDLFFLIINGAGGALGSTFAGLPDDSIVDVTSSADHQTYALEITYAANAQMNSFTGGHDVAAMVIGPVPEPNPLLLGLAGVAVVAGCRRRRSLGGHRSMDSRWSSHPSSLNFPA
jgi:MYXO-CTERM domain-containing protein